HLEDERQHERQRGGAAEPGQEAHDEAEGHADHHQPERRPGEHLQEAGDTRVKEVGDRRAPFRGGCYHGLASRPAAGRRSGAKETTSWTRSVRPPATWGSATGSSPTRAGPTGTATAACGPRARPGA